VGQVAEEETDGERSPFWGGGEEETYLGSLPTVACGGRKGDAGEGQTTGRQG
jgi:hypothetical protein